RSCKALASTRGQDARCYDDTNDCERRSHVESVSDATVLVSDNIARASSSARPAIARPVLPPVEAQSPSHAPGLAVIFSSLRHRDYRLLWIGTLLMSAGQWIQEVTLGWLMYDLTGSAALLGALNGFRSLPFLVFGPLAGVAADRLDRRRLLMVTQPVLA